MSSKMQIQIQRLKKTFESKNVLQNFGRRKIGKAYEKHSFKKKKKSLRKLIHKVVKF